MPEGKPRKRQTTAAVKAARKTKSNRREPTPTLYCGVIMPISAIDGCNEQHWSDVREILESSIDEAEFEARLVSDADEVGIIQKRIIQNVYDDPIVVCDVSGKNPNVMFELGMRLAFDKPTIIVKDDKTTYTFDTAPIEHLEYPRDLRFAKIVEFQANLSAKIRATYTKAQTDKNYTTFLKNFGSFSVAKLETRTLDKNDFILDELRALKSLVLRQPRVLEDSESSLIDGDGQDPNIQRLSMHRAVRRALLRLGPPKSSRDFRNQVVNEVMKGPPNVTRSFHSRRQFERAVDQGLKDVGIVMK